MIALKILLGIALYLLTVSFLLSVFHALIKRRNRQ
jgi:hypothetical protein